MKDAMFHTILSFFLHIQFEEVNVLFYILGNFPPLKCVLYYTFNLINTNHTIMGNACCVTLKLILYILTDLTTLHIQFVNVYVLLYIFGYSAPIKCVLYSTFDIIHTTH